MRVCSWTSTYKCTFSDRWGDIQPERPERGEKSSAARLDRAPRVERVPPSTPALEKKCIGYLWRHKKVICDNWWFWCLVYQGPQHVNCQLCFIRSDPVDSLNLLWGRGWFTSGLECAVQISQALSWSLPLFRAAWAAGRPTDRVVDS